MRAYDLIYTPKWKSVLGERFDVLFLEGPSQVSKTTLATIKLIYEAMKAPEGQTLMFLLGESTNTLYRNFIVPDTGITKLFPNCQYIGGGSSGGQRVEVAVWHEERKELKSIYFMGYTNKGSETKVLGSKPYMIMADEFNKAHDEMVKAVMTRVTAVGTKLMATSNGDSPDILMYDYFNACRPNPRYENDVPTSTMNDMEEVPEKKGWVYYYFGLQDRPFGTYEEHVEWIKRMYKMHPEGSFEYNSKVLGIRASTDGILYGHLLNRYHDIDLKDVNFAAITEILVGIDVGSGGQNTDKKRAKTVFVLKAYSRQYQRAIILDAAPSHQIGHVETVAELNAFLQGWWNTFRPKIKGIYIDSAEPALIATAKKHVKAPIDVRPSIKKNKLVTLQSRVSLREQMIYHNRLLFLKNKGAQWAKRELSKVKGLNGTMIDEDMVHNDVSDADDYATTPRFAELLKQRW